MPSSSLINTAEAALKRLCLEISNRSVGRAGNRAASDYFAARVALFGFETETPSFDCIDWKQEGASLQVDGVSYEAQVSPFSLSCKVQARLVVASTIEELEAAEASGQVLLVRGELAKEQLMPKNFPFYNPEEHQRIYALLEAANPAALIAATARNPQMAGAVYPFPLIEDGNFDIPSVYLTEGEGDRLAQQAGGKATLEIRSWRIPAQGFNVIARKGGGDGKRVVVFAHIDAKDGTPGALDNASGVVVLLLLAELLRDYSGSLGIELVAMNGEDYYACPGEIQWLAGNAGSLDDILLGINIDGAGYHRGNTAFSLYSLPFEIEQVVREVFGSYADIQEGEPWYQSDHSLFIQNGVPALAITSQEVFAILTEIAHTEADVPAKVDPGRLVGVASALKDLLLELDGSTALNLD
jgi:aminopeptidase YwaD